MDNVLTYLQANPGWHHLVDLLVAGVGVRTEIRTALDSLVANGLVESRVSAVNPNDTQYRALP